jgi:hypothetical protein
MAAPRFLIALSQQKLVYVGWRYLFECGFGIGFCKVFRDNGGLLWIIFELVSMQFPIILFQIIYLFLFVSAPKVLVTPVIVILTVFHPL